MDVRVRGNKVITSECGVRPRTTGIIAAICVWWRPQAILLPKWRHKSFFAEKTAF